jgi:fructose-1,6-bisphosphatase-3
MKQRVRVGETDNGRELKQQIADLEELLLAYRNGDLQEKGERILRYREKL